MQTTVTSKDNINYSSIERLKSDHEDDKIIPGKPTQNFLLLELPKNQVIAQQTTNGIPQIASKVGIFKVIAVGPDTRIVQPGDVVQVLEKAYQVPITWGSGRSFMVREQEICFIFDKDKDPRVRYKIVQDENSDTDTPSGQFKRGSKA